MLIVAVEERKGTNPFTQSAIGGAPGEQMTLYLLKGQGITEVVKGLLSIGKRENAIMGNKNVFQKRGPPPHCPLHKFYTDCGGAKNMAKGGAFPPKGVPKSFVPIRNVSLCTQAHDSRSIARLPPPSTERGRLLRSPCCQLCGQKTALWSRCRRPGKNGPFSDLRKKIRPTPNHPDYTPPEGLVGMIPIN